MMNHRFGWLALVAALFFVPIDALACSCMRPPPPVEAMERADAVFVGTPTGTTPARQSGVVVTLEVSESLKGGLGDSVNVLTQSNSAACGYPFEIGTKYLVYAFRADDGELVVSLCSRTAPLAQATAELVTLRGTPPREVDVETGESPAGGSIGENADVETGEQPDPKAIGERPVPPPPRTTDSSAGPAAQKVGEKAEKTEKTGRDRPVVTSPAEQEEGREELDMTQVESAPIVSIAAHAMFRYTMNFGEDDSAELYNLRLYLKKSWDDFTFYAEPRFRQTPLRSFSPSNIWIQQAWVGYTPVESARVRAGLIRTAFSRPWDNSWFGNLPYLNGLKLDPDYGIDVSGAPVVAGVVELEYAAQWLPASDGLNGFFAPIDKLDRIEAIPGDSVVIDFDSTPGYTERQAFVGRFVPALRLGDFKFAAGGSAYTAELINTRDEEGRKTALGVEGELAWRELSLYGEWIDADVAVEEDELSWTHVAAGIAYTFTRDAKWFRKAQGRFNISTADYDRQFAFRSDAATDELFFTIGSYVRIHEMVGFTAEYVRWTNADEEIVDRIEWILHAYF